MNILFITDLYPVSENEKITPRTLFDFVQEWEKQGHKVNVIKPNFILNSFLRGKPFYKTGQYGKVFNVNYWTPFWFDIKNKILNSINNEILKQVQNDGEHDNCFDVTLKFFQGLNSKKFLNQIQNNNNSTDNKKACPPDSLIIAHMPSGILFADKLGVPFVAGVHNSDLEVLTNPLYKFHFQKRLEKALHNAKAIACRSFVIKDKLLKLYPEFENKTFAAPSGIKKEIIKQNFHPLNKDKIKVLTCANFKKRKNIDKVIEACKGLENIELTVIGDGKGKKQLKKLDTSVNFTGYLPHNQVLEKMHDSDIFILPSIGETFGMVYLEAMSQGCITICTKDDGISGIIKNGENGFLTLPNANDIKKIILNIKNMDNDDLNTLRYNSFQTIQEYTSDKCAREYLQQIFKIL